MYKGFICLVCFLCSVFTVQDVYARNSSFYVSQAGYKVKVIIKYKRYKISTCKPIIKYALMRLPASWVKKVRKIIFTTKRVRFWHIYKVDPMTIAQYVPYLEWIYYYDDINDDSPYLFYSSIVHEYAHANGCFRRFSKWGFLKTLYKLMRAKNRYKSRYAEGIKFLPSKMEEFWAEIAGETLTRPLYMKKNYPDDFNFVQDVIKKTDPNFDILKHYTKNYIFFKKNLAQRLNDCLSGKIIKIRPKKILLKLRNGNYRLIKFMPYFRPIVMVSARIPLDVSEDKRIVPKKIWYKIKKIPQVGDKVILIKNKLLLCFPLTPKRLAKLKKGSSK